MIKTRVVLIASLLASLSLAVAGRAYAQVSNAVTGTYALVSSAAFGDDPRGVLNLGRDGHYSLIITRHTLPNMKSGTRTNGTPEENKSIIDGSVAHFGTFTVDTKESVIVFNCEASTFPNYAGTLLKRPFRIVGDRLIYSNIAPTDGGGAADVAWKRID